MDTKRKKKKRSRAAKTTTDNSSRHKPEDEEKNANRIIHFLTEALESVSLEESTSAHREINGEMNKTAEILTALTDSNSEDPLTSNSISGGSYALDWGSSSGSSLGHVETSCVQNMMNTNKKKGGRKKKRVVAVSGTVANVLGKDYVRASQRSAGRFKDFNDQNEFDKEEVEQFLCSMLGDECQLSMAVVRDVLCQCRYNAKKALDILLDLSASSDNQCRNDDDNDYSCKEDRRFIIECSDNLTDMASDCTSHSSESDLYDSIWSTGYSSRNYSKALTSSEVPSPIKPSGQSDLPQKVLESLFNISKIPEHETSTMNWRNVVKKLQPLGPRFDNSPSSSTEPWQELFAKGDEYQVFRKDAKEHSNSVKSFYQKATAAYSKGDWEYAAYLSEQGKTQNKLAQKADEKASYDIFKARNKGIENVITIDLHGQHVKPAMKLLKLHLLLGSYVLSVQTLRVITGCGSHGLGQSKLKQSVIKIAEEEGLGWSEENRGTVLIKLDGFREFSFLDTNSDSE